MTALNALTSRWQLLHHLSRREFEARYRGTVLGLAWAVLSPLALMALYTFVFRSILAARWPGLAAGDDFGYALNLLCGLTVFNLVAECLQRAPRLILENPSYVKKLVFPLDVLPGVALVGASISATIGYLVLLLFSALLPGPLFLTALLWPLLLLPLALFCLGTLYLLAALGVYLRDLQQLTSPLTMVLMFLSPVFYPLSNIPERWRQALALNPLAAAIEWSRGALFRGDLPGFTSYAAQLLAGVLILVLGWRLFRSLRSGFADVL